MKKSTRTLIAAPVAALLLLAGGAAAYGSHYQDLALPGSAVAGTSVAGLSRAEVAQAIRDRAAKVEVTISAGGSSQQATLAELGSTIDVEATVDRVFAANRSWTSYARALVAQTSVPAVVVVDHHKLDAAVTALVAAKGTPSVNAAVELATGATTFTVTPDTPGTTADPATLQQVIAQAAATLTSATAHVRFVTGTAQVTTAAAQAIADKANAIVATPVTITAGAAGASGAASASDATIEASAAEKASWVKIPVANGVPGAPSIDHAAVAAWVQAKAEGRKVGVVNGVRNVSAASGAVLRVATQARDGSQVTNAAQVADAIVAALTADTGYTGTFETATIPATWTDRTVAAGAEGLAYAAAEGEKWVDVNLTNHTMTGYEGGRPVIGPVAMVNGAPATPTVTGTYAIYAKYASQTMRGNNADGSSYVAENVPWVSYFTGGYALHGAPWRDTFGYTGSHGCVNLPVPVAEQVFDWAPIGTVVVSHN